MYIKLIILIAICSWTYVIVLTRNEMILCNLRNIVERLPKWLHKPLISCEYCVAGQVAFWYYIFNFNYNVLGHIAFTLLTIFTIEIINKLIYGRY